MSAPLTPLEFLEHVFGDCIDHEHEQVGPCVYCRTCGRRMYHGKVLTAAELAEIRQAMTELRETG